MNWRLEADSFRGGPGSWGRCGHREASELPGAPGELCVPRIHCWDSRLKGWAGPGRWLQVLLTLWLPPTGAGPGGWEAPGCGLPDSTLLGRLAFPASQLPSATAAAARSPQGCSLILGSHADMLAHVCKPPASTPRHSPVPHSLVCPFQLGVRVRPQAGGAPPCPQPMPGIQADSGKQAHGVGSVFPFSDLAP